MRMGSLTVNAFIAVFVNTPQLSGNMLGILSAGRLCRMVWVSDSPLFDAVTEHVDLGIKFLVAKR